MNCMEVVDLQTLDPAQQIDQQVRVLEGSCSGVVKEPHTEPCLPDTLTMDAIQSNAKRLMAPTATLEDLEIQLSEACLKNYVVFDQCADHRTLICHPTLSNGLPSLVPSVTKSMNEALMCLQSFSEKAAENFLNTCHTARHGVSGLLPYRESTEVARVQGNDYDCSGHTLMACLNPVEDIQNNCSNPGKGIKSPWHEETDEDIQNKCTDPGQGFESPWHEDTDDINALLSSDEELSSTCRILSDVDVNSYALLNNSGDEHSSSNRTKKRKIDNAIQEEDADGHLVHSDADSTQKVTNGCECKNFCGSHSSKCPHIPQGSLSENSGFLWGERLLSKATFHDRFGSFEQNSVDNTGVVRQAKIIKLKETFEDLKTIIPGGFYLDDAVSVLESAVQYIKSLQARLVNKEARNEIQVNAH